MFVNIQPVFKFRVIKTPLSFWFVLKSHYRSVKPIKLASQYYRPPEKRKDRHAANVNEAENELLDEEDEETKIQELLDRNVLSGALFGHRVFVVQPFIKWGVLKKRNTTPELQLMESVNLIKTLRQYSVVDQRIVSLQRIRKNTVFGPGVLRDLREVIKCNSKITAVFISLNTLTMLQQNYLQTYFKVPVFDRYSVIMHIFKEHAQTKEAKLQVKLAQLPYLWTVLKDVGNGMNEKWGISNSYFGACESRLSEKREVFRRLSAKIKNEIQELRQQRNLLRKKREKQEIPVVAVIGYTNAGKTSLVKALTGKETLEPQDYLFATLDVTAHLGTLPCGLKAYFIDTLGFITDIPTYCIESFVSTLEDAILADVIVHVRDISHPDTVAQNDKVIEILSNLKIPEGTFKNIITVGNKIDLVDSDKLKNFNDLVLVSSTNLTGINVLRQELEKKIIQVTDIVHIIIKVKSGGSEYFWLYDNATVINETPDEKNSQFTFVETLISSTSLSKFKHNFITNYKN